MGRISPSDGQLRRVIGRNVRRARQAQGLTQTHLSVRIEQLAGEPGVARQGSISSIERGVRSPSVEMLVLLASALDVTVTELVVAVSRSALRPVKVRECPRSQQAAP